MERKSRSLRTEAEALEAETCGFDAPTAKGGLGRRAVLLCVVGKENERTQCGVPASRLDCSIKAH